MQEEAEGERITEALSEVEDSAEEGMPRVLELPTLEAAAAGKKIILPRQRVLGGQAL